MIPFIVYFDDDTRFHADFEEIDGFYGKDFENI